jgi:8-oxo-dGTP pyrophosphatase MutT (NUDIX family)
MVRRHSKAVFASYCVFPGGVLDPEDAASHARSTGVSAGEANAMIGVEKGGLDYYSAAIREAFEESSVLLARTADGDWAFANRTRDEHEIERCRDQLNSGELAWADFLEQKDFRPAYDALHYVAYWVTPREAPRRFSTRFFLALMPPGQRAVHDDGELTDSHWMTADEVLQAGKRGDMKLMHPTFCTLRDIAQHDNVDEVVAWARQRGQSGEARLRPAWVDIDGVYQVVMPGSPFYPDEVDS